MNSLPDNFTLDSQSGEKRKQHEDQRKLGVELTRNVREMVAIREQKPLVYLNPLSEALKGIDDVPL